MFNTMLFSTQRREARQEQQRRCLAPAGPGDFLVGLGTNLSITSICTN